VIPLIKNHLSGRRRKECPEKSVENLGVSDSPDDVQ